MYKFAKPFEFDLNIDSKRKKCTSDVGWTGCWSSGAQTFFRRGTLVILSQGALYINIVHLPKIKTFRKCIRKYAVQLYRFMTFHKIFFL